MKVTKSQTQPKLLNEAIEALGDTTETSDRLAREVQALLDERSGDPCVILHALSKVLLLYAGHDLEEHDEEDCPLHSAKIAQTAGVITAFLSHQSLRIDEAMYLYAGLMGGLAVEATRIHLLNEQRKRMN